MSNRKIAQSTQATAGSALRSMIARYRLVACFILACAALLAPLARPARLQAAPPPMARSDQDTLMSTVDEYVEQERQAARVPGIALAIVEDDQVVHLQGFGEADPSGRAVTPQTPFIIGSNAKSFTALAIMQLVEAGKIELDAPVQRYLPWFRVADPEASARITVRHLLNHTSGLPRGVGNSEMATTQDMRDGALEQQVRNFSTAQLTAPVGATWQYSNAGYVTLGLLVQTVSGQSYERYVAEHIFAPLQMQRSFTDPAAAQAAGLAAGYRYWFGRPVAFDAPFNRSLLPAGLLMASGEDMAHFLIAQLNDGRYDSTAILSPAGLAELHRGAVPTPDGAWPGLDEGQYGMGWFTGKRNGVEVIGHRGDSGNFHAAMVLVPEERRCLVLLMNANSRISGERMAAITDGVLSLVVGQPPSPPVASTLDLMDIILRGILALAAMQLLAMIWSAYTLRRLVRGTPGMMGGWLSIVRYVVLPLVFYLLLALVFLVILPMLFRYQWPLLLLGIPDYGTVALVAGVAALGWAIIRTAVALTALQRRSRVRVAGAPAPA